MPKAARATPPTPASTGSFATAHLPELEHIFNVDTSLCLLQRSPDRTLQRYLSGHSPASCHERAQRVLAEQAELDSVLQDFAQPGRICLENELRFLIELFATLSDSRWVGVRLSISHQRSCPRFHVDKVGLRLICTLQGPGTEWLEHECVDRRFLGFGSQGIPDEGSGLLKSGAQIHRMQTFEVGLFKGELWPGNENRSAVHRSPAVKPLSPHRIVVTLDEVE